MMNKLIARGKAVARQAQAARVQRVATHLSSVLGSSAVEAREAQVLVRGKGIIKRWLIDPSLRFLAGDSK